MNRRLLAFFILSLSVFTLVQAQFSRNFTSELSKTPAGRAFLQTYGALQAAYLDDVDNDAILQGAIQGMLSALDDPYTSYSVPDEAERSSQDRQGSFEGIGAVLSPRNRAEDKIVEIINVYRGGPAWNAGVRAGDIFIEVDGTNVEDYTTTEIVGVVRGPKGSTVTLGMRRPGEDNIVYFSIVRDKIDIVSVESTMLPQNVGYVRITTFGNQRVYEQLRTQLGELEQAGATSLILDLRNNGGGLLNQGILVSDAFLSEGDIVFQRSRGMTQRLASADRRAFALPMVVLVNRYSASASEIVAGALQDNGRALVIGEETFGKGVGQSVLPLENGGQLVYLSFEWLTPSRRSINKQGIVPDVHADDELLADLVALEGRGVDEGQEVEIYVEGELLGTAVADEEGVFRFIELRDRPDMSAVQGEAIVDLENDPALTVAFDVLLNGAPSEASHAGNASNHATTNATN